MDENYKIKQKYKTYEIKKCNEENMTVGEICSILDELIKQGKSDYSVHTEGFCIAVSSIEVSDEDKEISF